MIYSKILPIFLLLFAIEGVSKEAGVIFDLEIEPENPDIGFFSADTSELGEFTLLPPRKRGQSYKNSQAVLCIKDESQFEAQYSKPLNCDRLEWVVKFLPISNFDVNVSEQKNIFSDEGWWVLFEWGVIQKYKGSEPFK